MRAMWITLGVAYIALAIPFSYEAGSVDIGEACARLVLGALAILYGMERDRR